MAKSKNKQPIYRTQNGDGERVFIHPADSLATPKHPTLGVQVVRVRDGHGYYADPSKIVPSK